MQSDSHNCSSRLINFSVKIWIGVSRDLSAKQPIHTKCLISSDKYKNMYIWECRRLQILLCTFSVKQKNTYLSQVLCDTRWPGIDYCDTRVQKQTRFKEDLVYSLCSSSAIILKLMATCWIDILSTVPSFNGVVKVSVVSVITRSVSILRITRETTLLSNVKTLTCLLFFTFINYPNYNSGFSRSFKVNWNIYLWAIYPSPYFNSLYFCVRLS